MSEQGGPDESQPQQSRKSQIITEEKVGEDEYNISIQLPALEDDKEDDFFLFLGLTEEELEYNLSIGREEKSDFPYKQGPNKESKQNEADKSSASDEIRDLLKKDVASEEVKEQTENSKQNDELKDNGIKNNTDKSDSDSCCSDRLSQESPSSLDEEEWFVSRKCDIEDKEEYSIEDVETVTSLPENTSIT